MKNPTDNSVQQEKKSRVAERARKIAAMQKNSHPLAGPALQMHREITQMEEALQKKRAQLMAILRFEG